MIQAMDKSTDAAMKEALLAHIIGDVNAVLLAGDKHRGSPWYTKTPEHHRSKGLNHLTRENIGHVDESGCTAGSRGMLRLYMADFLEDYQLEEVSLCITGNQKTVHAASASRATTAQ
jgi:hypothetical protein